MDRAQRSSELTGYISRADIKSRAHQAVSKQTANTEAVSFDSLLSSSGLRSVRSMSESAPRQTSSASGGKSAGVAFEGSVLSSLIQSMFSLSAKSAFGGGLAGSSFSSLYASHIANQIAATKSIGIAGMIDRAHSTTSDALSKNDIPRG
jgi:Rod binding domain-containing protein